MKKIFGIVIIYIAFFGVTNIDALESKNDYKINQGGGEEAYLYNKHLSEKKYNEILKSQRFSAISTNQNIARGGQTYYSIGADYPIYHQELNYYCGPAVVKQAIQWITGSSNSQSYYANQMGTNENDGTIVYNLTVNGINANQNTWVYGYTYVPNLDSREALWNIVVQNITVDHIPVIVHASLEDLYMYNGQPGGHYITLVAYTVDHLSDYYNIFHYVDTFSANYGFGNTFGIQDISYYDLYDSLNNRGRYIIW